MDKCPFLDDHPDLFIIGVAIIVCAYVLYYTLHCFILLILDLMKKGE